MWIFDKIGCGSGKHFQTSLFCSWIRLSSMDDDFIPIMSSIDDEISIFATVFSISMKRIWQKIFHIDDFWLRKILSSIQTKIAWYSGRGYFCRPYTALQFCASKHSLLVVFSHLALSLNKIGCGSEKHFQTSLNVFLSPCTIFAIP